MATVVGALSLQCGGGGLRPHDDLLALRRERDARHRPQRRRDRLDERGRRHRHRNRTVQLPQHQSGRPRLRRRDVHDEPVGRCGRNRAGQRQRERRAGRRREQQLVRLLQIRVRADRATAAGMHFEMEVRCEAVGVTGVADVGDLLPGLHARAVTHRVRGPLHALAAVVVLERQVVVEMDVVVDRSALAIEIEHAARAARRRPVLDRACLGGDGGRTLRRHQVVALVRAAASRRAEVVDVLHRPDDREDDVVGHVRRRCTSRPGDGAEQDGEQEKSSGCRPVASHNEDGRSGSRPKGKRLAAVSAQ